MNASASSAIATTGKEPVAAARAMDGAAVTKRLQRELMELMSSGDKSATAFPDGDNLFEWRGSITGADGTVYAGKKYQLKLKFPADYPFSPPTVTFETPCFHPNVDTKGNICLDILQDMWSAANSVRTLLLSLQSLLADPNNDSPLNAYAAGLWADQASYQVVLDQKYAAGQA